MQLSQVRNIVKTLLDEDGIRRPDSVLDLCINDGYQLVGGLTQACEKTFSFSYPASMHHMFIDRDIFSPVAVSIAGTRLYPIRLTDLDDLSSTWMDTTESTPIYYSVNGLLSEQPKLFLHPRPTSTTTVKLTAALIPDRLVNDTETFMFPQNYHYTIVWWATMWELLKERQPYLANKAYRMFQEFVSLVNELQAYVYRRTPDRDYVSMSWENTALVKKMEDFEIALKRAQASDQQDISL